MCFTDKPLSEFYDANTKRGKQYMCIPCYKTYFKEWRLQRKTANQADFPQSKTCLQCHVEKPISQFGKRSISKDKKNDYCVPCWRIKTKESLRKHYAKKTAI